MLRSRRIRQTHCTDFVSHTHKWYLIDQHTDLHVSTNIDAANLGIQTLGVAKFLVNYAGQPAQDDLLPTRLPDKAKPKKAYCKAFGRSYTDAETAEFAADQAEQRSRVAADQTARPNTSETSCEDPQS
jgi:hypothetical protein